MLSWETSLQILLWNKSLWKLNHVIDDSGFKGRGFKNQSQTFKSADGMKTVIRCDLILWNERECCFRTIFLLLLQSNTEEVMCCLQELTIICRCGLFLSQQNAFLWHLKDTDCRPDQGTSAGHQDAPYIDLNGRLGVPFWPRKEESHWGHLLHDIQKSHQPVK